MKIGVLGTGNIVKSVAPTITQMEAAQCYAIASRTKERAQEAAAEYGFEKAYGTYEELVALSNEEVAEAVRLVTKEKGYDMDEYMRRIKANPMARMVKLADRVHNLAEAKFASEKFQRKYVKETDDYFIDLAKGTVFEEDLNRVLEDVRSSLEDICL